MEGQQRRKEILNRLQNSNIPINGTELANHFNISRQIIVQDIAILRAEEHPILSTNRGYLLRRREYTFHRTFCVKHTSEQIYDELTTIIDNGGKVLNTTVEHDIYGQITVEMFLRNRRDINDFVKQFEQTKALPLTSLTGGIHFHTVTAESEEDLDEIEMCLKEKGYYISL